MSIASDSIYPPSKRGDPTWEVAQLFPTQGNWSEADFFRLHGNRMAELVDGVLEVLPMPTWMHQLMVDYVCDAIKEQIRCGVGGRVLFAPLPTRLFPGTIREPDVLYVSPENIPADPRGYPDRLDLAVEIVSEGPEARKRDYVDKRRDYAKAKIPEYWIVDPEDRIVLVLTLSGDQYDEHGVFGLGDTATGKRLPGLELDVSKLMKLTEGSEPS